MSPTEVRLSQGWGLMFESPGKITVADAAAVRPVVFGRSDDGELYLRSRCYGCQLEVRFPLPDPGLLSAFAVKLAQHVLCEECIAKTSAAETALDRAKARADRVGDSGIPRGLAREVSWDSLMPKGQTAEETAKRAAAIEAAHKWAKVKEPGRGLLFFGPAGSGKTRLAGTVAMTRLEHSPIQWVSVAVLMAELAGAWNDDDRKLALKVLTSKHAAVLDDLDKINPTPNALAQIFTALDKREQSKAPLVVTTNLRPSELEKKMGSVIVSRLLGMCTVYEYPGPDRRLEIGES